MTRIVKAWLLLVGLTGATLGLATIGAGFPRWAHVTAVLCLAGLKAGLILIYFVNIGRSRTGWRTILFVYLVALCALLITFNTLSCKQLGFQCTAA